MDFLVKESIISVVTSAITATVDTMQAKHKEKMFALREIIEKSLLLRKSPFPIPLPSLIATPKAYPGANSLSKTTRKKWNQFDLGHFDSHLN